MEFRKWDEGRRRRSGLWRRKGGGGGALCWGNLGLCARIPLSSSNVWVTWPINCRGQPCASCSFTLRTPFLSLSVWNIDWIGREVQSVIGNGSKDTWNMILRKALQQA
ncbi:hypothetical protein CDAR_317861 [Caerostris darwini]|uniref:Uncharacterized protein n=1 Tax=Caerostris darwini TaxID=1538125 RepID=A0AAV4WQX8_9ARAC|nr:hypothetical protein CDAR_317861 [Caerostris darwini]